MSLQVLVIPEDPVQNGYILKPLVQALMRDVDKPAAKVKVLNKPRVRGYVQALNAIRNELPEVYGFMHLWLFFPDADRATSKAMQDLEVYAATKGIPLLCCAAQPELEIYACVAFRDAMPCKWEEARNHSRMKEEIFEPLLKKHGDPRRPDKGRDRMIRQSLENMPLVFQLCPELKQLRNRIATHLQQN